jgi:hypothetical protein
MALIEADKKKREKHLKLILEKYGVTDAINSYECKKYVESTSKLSLNDLIAKICKLKYLNDYCDIKNAHRLAKKQLGDQEYFSMWYGEYPEGYFNKVQEIALNGSLYPEKWPWLK